MNRGKGIMGSDHHLNCLWDFSWQRCYYKNGMTYIYINRMDSSLICILKNRVRIAQSVQWLDHRLGQLRITCAIEHVQISTRAHPPSWPAEILGGGVKLPVHVLTLMCGAIPPVVPYNAFYGMTLNEAEWHLNLHIGMRHKLERKNMGCFDMDVKLASGG